MIGDMIKKLRSQKQILQNDLGEALSLSTSAVGMYEQNRRLPDTDTIIKLCDLFSVSADYILELSGSPQQYSKSTSNLSICDRLNQILNDRNLDKDSIAINSNIRKSRLLDILENRKKPDANELRSLSICLNVTSDYLLGYTDEFIEAYSDAELYDLMNSNKEYYPETNNRFGKIMRDYRANKNIPITGMAKELGISPETYNGIEDGRFFPNLKLLKRVSEFTQIPVDYLTGALYSASVETDEGIEINGISFPISQAYCDFTFFSRFEELCMKYDISMLNCNEKLLISQSEYNDIKFNRMPTLSELLKLAYAFSVSVDYLIGKIDSRVDNIINVFMKLNEDNQDIIIGEMKKYLKEQRIEEAVAAVPSSASASGK